MTTAEAGHDCECPRKVIYQWDSGLHYDALSDDERQDLFEFLAAHGINHLAVPIGNQVTIRARCDGSEWLEMWRAVGNVDMGVAPTCAYCPECVAQELVVMPLVELPPPLPGAHVPGTPDP